MDEVGDAQNFVHIKIRFSTNAQNKIHLSVKKAKKRHPFTKGGFNPAFQEYPVN